MEVSGDWLLYVKEYQISTNIRSPQVLTPRPCSKQVPSKRLLTD